MKYILKKINERIKEMISLNIPDKEKSEKELWITTNEGLLNGLIE